MSDILIKDATLSVKNEKNFVFKLKKESDISLVYKMFGMLNAPEKNKLKTEDQRILQTKELLMD